MSISPSNEYPFEQITNRPSTMPEPDKNESEEGNRTPASARLNWQGEFVSRTLEQQFQSSKWAFNAHRMKFVCGLTALVYLAAAPADYFVLGATRSFTILLIFRALTAAAGAANFFLAFRREPFSHYAHSVAAYMILVCISESVDSIIKFQVIGDQMIPFTVIIILAFYLFLPVRTYPTLTAALLGSLIYLLSLVLFTGVTPENLSITFLFLILVNAFGLYFLITFSRSQRREFFALKEERRLNEELKNEMEHRRRVEEEQQILIDSLQKAIDEVKTLRGLIPICANCKKIRDDEGYWRQIEVYIQERSSAKFSHGICPECAKKLYPEFFK